MAQKFIFQTIASMGPSSIYNLFSCAVLWQSFEEFQERKNQDLWSYWFGVGSCASSAIFVDKPVEEAVEWVFHKGFEVVGGKEYVGDSPSVGREQALEQKHQKANRNKEL